MGALILRRVECAIHVVDRNRGVVNVKLHCVARPQIDDTEFIGCQLTRRGRFDGNRRSHRLGEQLGHRDVHMVADQHRNLHDNLVAAYLDRIARQPGVRIQQQLAGIDPVLVTVPGTGQHTVLQRAFADRPAAVQATVLQRMPLSIDEEDADGKPLGLDNLAPLGDELGQTAGNYLAVVDRARHSQAAFVGFHGKLVDRPLVDLLRLLVGLGLTSFAIDSRKLLQQHHQQCVPAAHGAKCQLRIDCAQFRVQRGADALLDKADHSHDVAFRDVDGGIGALRRVGAPDVIHKTGVVLVENRRGRAPPEGRLVLHAQLQILLVDGAVLLLEVFARRRKAEQMRVKVGHDIGDVLFDDEASGADSLSVLRFEVHKLRHEIEIAARIGRAALETFLGGEFGHYCLSLED